MLINVQKLRNRALVDSGAKVSLIQPTVYEHLKKTVKLGKKKVSLKSVNGDKIEVKGAIDLSFKVGQNMLQHKFHVVKGINRKVFLGKDWLLHNGVRLYFDLCRLKVGGE